jgi:hypothetical protein
MYEEWRYSSTILDLGSEWRCEGRPARKADNFTAICEPIV